MLVALGLSMVCEQGCLSDGVYCGRPIVADLSCRLSPVACRLSPVACRLSPVACRLS
ncbi:hypothetical protein [Asaia spathodeae]|uniref:hypothetical protein n=1 Tax=Asaia spathodeae TaxID=657016 RepID=UPI002FC27958